MNAAQRLARRTQRREREIDREAGACRGRRELI